MKLIITGTRCKGMLEEMPLVLFLKSIRLALVQVNSNHWSLAKRRKSDVIPNYHRYLLEMFPSNFIDEKWVLVVDFP